MTSVLPPMRPCMADVGRPLSSRDGRQDTDGTSRKHSTRERRPLVTTTAGGGRGPTLQDRIIELIHEQRLAPGATLPTEPQLMDLLGAGRNSVREAVRALQALG